MGDRSIPQDKGAAQYSGWGIYFPLAEELEGTMSERRSTIAVKKNKEMH